MKNYFLLTLALIFSLSAAACGGSGGPQTATEPPAASSPDAPAPPEQSSEQPIDIPEPPAVSEEQPVSPPPAEAPETSDSPEKAFFDLQDSVDSGHYPWRISPEEVAFEFASRELGLKGEAALVSRDEKESARVAFTDESGKEIHIDLYQPALKGGHGIWEVECWFGEDSRQHQVRDLTALPPLFYNDGNVPQNVKEAIRNTVVKDWAEAFGAYYNVLGFYAENVSYIGGDTAEVNFTMAMATQNFCKDPDTVEYIKEAKEKGSEHYQQLYDEYNMPKIGNFQLKVTMSPGTGGEIPPESVRVFTDIDPTAGEEYVLTGAEDFILD